jgi:hypothetical protein
MRDRARRALSNPTGWVLFQFAELALLLVILRAMPGTIPSWTAWIVLPIAIGAMIWGNLRLLSALGLRTRGGGRRGARGA